MDDQIVKPKRGRGKGKRPALAHVNLRVPADVMEYFRQFPSYTAKMREVLTEHARSLSSEGP